MARFALASLALLGIAAGACEASAQPIPPAVAERTPLPGGGGSGDAARAPRGASLAESLGLTAASRRLGQEMPDGSADGGVILGLVEGGGAAYAPDPNSSVFRGLEVELVGGPSEVSGHAQKTGSILAGRRGVVARARKLWSADVSTWAGPTYLALGSQNPPAVGRDLPSVWSHSWVGFDERGAVPMLRRLDFAIDRDDSLHIVGVNNGADSKVPPSLAGAYNAIAVGVDSGASSSGGTTGEDPGRSKPDLVAPGGLTSWATPAVAGVAALARDFLLRRDGTPPPAEVVKAALLAGAEKPPGWRHEPEAGQPLDTRFGAGRVNADATFRVLEGGPLAPGETISSVAGHGFAVVPAGGVDTRLSWDLDLPVDAGAFSVVATWHRRIAARRVRVRLEQDGPEVVRWLTAPRHVDLNLQVVKLDAEGRFDHVLERSQSRIDNVEHVFLEALPAGRYRIQLSRAGGAEPWDAAVAWRLHPAGRGAPEEPPLPATPLPEPASEADAQAAPQAQPDAAAAPEKPASEDRPSIVQP